MKEFTIMNNKTVILRHAVKEDAENIIKYINKMVGETDFMTFGEGEFDVTVEREEGFLESVKENPNSIFILAEVDEHMVGNCSLISGHRSRTRHITDLGISVVKEYWGNGIGNELLNYVIEWARDTNSIKKINLKVRVDNEKATNLYEKFGFVKEGRITRDFLIDGEYYDAYAMGLIIE